MAEAIAATNPEAIVNVEFGSDLVKLVREGATRGLFEGRSVVSFLTDEPEYLDPLKSEAPGGWLTTGYPGTGSTRPNTRRFSTPTKPNTTITRAWSRSSATRRSRWRRRR